MPILKKIFVTSFFGWDNWKFLITELIKIYSSKDSYFSKKRIESSIAFFTGIGIVACYVWSHRHTLQNSEMIADVSILFLIAGYQIAQTQRDKIIDKAQ